MNISWTPWTHEHIKVPASSKHIEFEYVTTTYTELESANNFKNAKNNRNRNNNMNQIGLNGG